MPVQAFMDAFLPSIPADREKEILTSKNAFKDVPSSGSKPSDIYNPLLAALNRSTERKSRAPGLVFENASERSTEPHTPGLMKPHICCYTRQNVERVRETPISARAELGYAELFFEVKPDIALDVFADPPPDATIETRRSHDFFTHFHVEECKRRAERAFGQHIGYALEIQARQHRTFLFSISMAGSCARFLRWDRSGIIVTESFDIHTFPDLLAEFLARFALATDRERGHDVSVEMASAKEEGLFRDAVTKHVKDQLNVEDDDLTRAATEHYQAGCVYAIHMFVENSTDISSSTTPAVERYLVSRPVTSPLNLVGRTTRGYWAVQASSGRVVFLKDTWRPYREREGSLIAELNAAGVRNIPQFVAEADVHQQYSPVLLKIQYTETDLYDASPWVCSIRGRHISVSTHVHYRLVLGTVGYPLRRLKGTNELLHAAYDVFQAMKDALSKAQRIHRDISIGNIVLVKEPGSDTRKGYLIDWETSSAVDSEGNSINRNRTGTWKFMSAKVLWKPEQPHTLEDDMESLLYVVLYCALLYLPHNLDDVSLEAVIERLFDESMDMDDGLRGGAGKMANRVGRVSTEWIKFTNPDLQKYLDDTMDLHGRVGFPSAESSLIWRVTENLEKLWSDFFATHTTLASGDRVENELPEVYSLLDKTESSLVTFVPPRPASPAKTPVVGEKIKQAQTLKRQRDDPESSRRSERLRSRPPPPMSPPVGKLAKATGTVAKPRLRVGRGLIPQTEESRSH
ncbi:hypothetical protein C2E23DRAFT_743069 [Lenzites betulinus]|nr:hypothetical protein C2E23DRAFT_743069 [Lenzites betulinus]